MGNSRYRKHNQGRQSHGVSLSRPRNNSAVQVWDPILGSPEAIKTYLNQEVALLRPQVSYSEIAHLYRLAVTFRAAVELRSEALRQVDFKVADANGELLETRPELFTEQAQTLQYAFSNNFASVIERSETSFCCYGEVLLRQNTTQSGELDGFQWINNNFFRRETDVMHGLRGFRIRPVWGSDLDPDFDFIRPSDAVYMHNIDFFEDFGGTGALMVAYAQAATETEITATQLMFFRNMAMPSFVIQPANDSSYIPGPDQKSELTEYLRRMYQGAANAGRTVVLPTRWEMLKFTQDFDKIGMPNLSDQARDACLRILRVPLELIEPRQSNRGTGVKFYDQKREWLIAWLVPQAERYADVFTEQIAKLINPAWRIIPTFKRVRGLDEDISSRTKTVTDQLKAGVLDLASAQKTLGIKVDPNLEKEPIYMIGGIPVPSSQMAQYWRYAPGNPGMVQGGEPSPGDKPSRKPEHESRGDAISSDSGPAKSVVTFLPDDQHREIKRWREIVTRKGRLYAFEAKSLPAHAVAYGRFLLATEDPSESMWNLIRGQAVKAYSDTEDQYRTSLYELMTDAFNSNLDRTQFGIAGRSEIEHAFMSAFSNGLAEAGVDPNEMTDEERDVITLETKAERSYWTALANDMYRRVMPLKGSPEFGAARDSMLGRIELWVNKGLDRMYQLGNMYGKSNAMKKFVLGGTIDHCKTCSGANGQVHRARTWLKWGIYPKSDNCLCGGFKCECDLVDTTERAHGSLANVPVALGAKEHDHELEAIAI